MLYENGEFERIRPHLTPLECGIIFDGIPEGAISRKVGLIWGIPVKAISGGDNHTCELRENGTAVCWGEDAQGQSSPPEEDTFVSISSGYRHTCGLREDGTFVCWGGPEDKRPSSLPGETFTAIAIGGNHTCVLREDGTAFCWGSNTFSGNDRFVGQATPPYGERFTAITRRRCAHLRAATRRYPGMLGCGISQQPRQAYYLRRRRRGALYVHQQRKRLRVRPAPGWDSGLLGRQFRGQSIPSTGRVRGHQQWRRAHMRPARRRERYLLG